MERLVRYLLFIFVAISLTACEQADGILTAEITAVSANESNGTTAYPTSAIAEYRLDDDKRYLFDITTHTKDELHILLNRIEEIHNNEREKYEDLDLVLILHGPDINHFTQKNYLENKTLVDQAARLDAFGMIDMKICETYMSMIGIEDGEVPPFIEPVPYAQKEIERLTDIGYINL